MTSEDDFLPGNLGLWDQKLALEWIQLNIASFGGDPDQVTLAGSGSGGTSALLHYMSPQSRGLFKAVISLSSSLVFNQAHPSKYTRMLAEKLGCASNSSSKALLECLNSKTSEAKNSILT